MHGETNITSTYTPLNFVHFKIPFKLLPFSRHFL